MSRIKKTFEYLRKYKFYSAAVIFFVIFGAMLEGISIGMLIPFLELIVSPGKSIFSGVPLLNKFNFFAGPAEDRGRLFAILLIIFTLILFKNVFIFLGKRLMWRLRFALYRDFKDDLLGRLLMGGLVFFDSSKSGHIMHSFNRETELIAGYMYCFLNLAAILIQIAVYCLLLSFISWRFMFLSVCLMAMVFPAAHFIRKKKEALARQANQRQAEMNFILLEILTGIRVIKLFIAEKIMKSKYDDTVNRFIEKQYRGSIWQELITPASEIIAMSLVALSFTAVFFISINLNAALPSAVAFIWVLMRIMSQLSNFNHYRTEMAGSIGAFESYEDFLNKVMGSVLTEGKVKINGFKEKIEFKDVSFTYGGVKAVLEDINFTIPKSGTTAFVGSSGAGKTTMVNLISRLYDVTSGAIFVDGVNLKDIDSSSWRSMLGFVSQEVFIFNADVKENIAFGLPQASEEEVISAAKSANIHDFIISLPDGYATVLGERGIKLSGGQKQRISIARAIIRNPQILILDEATSSLDSESERLIQEALGRACRNRTVIIIAHRLSTIQNADRLIVIEGGRISEQGTHEELLRLNGRYSRLYNIQYGRMLLE